LTCNAERTILEKTTVGKQLETETFFKGFTDEMSEKWDKASAKFTDKAIRDYQDGKISGVDVFIDEANYRRKESIWESIEMKKLKDANVLIAKHHFNSKKKKLCP